MGAPRGAEPPPRSAGMRARPAHARCARRGRASCAAPPVSRGGGGRPLRAAPYRLQPSFSTRGGAGRQGGGSAKPALVVLAGQGAALRARGAPAACRGPACAAASSAYCRG